MTDMTPTKFDFNTVTGLSKTAKPIARPLSSLKGYFADTAAYEPTAEHCQPDYLKTLPDNKAREDLVEKCMTGGSYKKSEPKTW